MQFAENTDYSSDDLSSDNDYDVDEITLFPPLHIFWAIL